MKYLVIIVFASFFFLTGCTGTLKYEDVSCSPEYKKWIGKEFKLTDDVFIVSDPHYDKILFLEIPDRQRFPSIESYKADRRGGPPWNICLDPVIVGVANVRDKYKIVAVGYYVFSITIGRTGVVVVKDQDGKEYYIREPGLFYFDNKTKTLDPHDAYVEMLPVKDEKPPDNKSNSKSDNNSAK